MIFEIIFLGLFSYMIHMLDNKLTDIQNELAIIDMNLDKERERDYVNRYKEVRKR